MLGILKEAGIGKAKKFGHGKSEIGCLAPCNSTHFLNYTISKVGYILEHNCTIFLCSLDVRNIVQGGDPLYAGFFSTQGSGGYT